MNVETTVMTSRNVETTVMTSTFLGAHAIPPEFRENKAGYIDLIVNHMLPYIGSKKLTMFCDVFCEKGFFDLAESRSILLQGKQFGLRSKINAERLSSLGGAELAAEVGAISADHLEHVTEEG